MGERVVDAGRIVDAVPSTTHRLTTVMARLEEAGFSPRKDSVKRASDKFLGFDTLSRGGHRRWTDGEIEQLIVAYRLRHECEIQWPRIAEMFHDDATLAEHLEIEIAEMESEIDALRRRRTESEDLLRDLASNRTAREVDAA